jgi:hypothetical protein
MMATTDAEAAFVRQPFRTVKTGPVTAVVTAFGDLARRTQEPIGTDFEAEADAQAMSDQRQSLLGANRRRTTVTVGGAETGMGLVYSGVALTAQVINDQRALDAPHLIAELVIDLDREVTKLETYG